MYRSFSCWPVMSDSKHSQHVSPLLSRGRGWAALSNLSVHTFPSAQLSALENLPAAVEFCWMWALEGSLGTLGAAHLQYGDAAPKHYPRCARHYALCCPRDTASEEPWTQCLSSGFMTAGLNKVSKWLSSVFALPNSPHWWEVSTF